MTVRKPLFFLIPLGLILIAAACRSASAAPVEEKKSTIRIVNCDAKVQSRKRGVCANHLEPADFTALAPGVSWWYSWHFKTDDKPPQGTPMQFLPMAWGDRPEDLAGLKAYLAAGNRPRTILAINEPNLKGQAFITPEQTATLYKKVKAIADPYKIPVVGPHMALGSPTKDSITAMDPVENKEMTYTFMMPFLKSFFFYADKNKTETGSTALHTYGAIGEMRWAVETMYKEFKRPVWVTEYNQWNAPNAEAARTYLMQSTDFLERSPYVEGYAWFKERMTGESMKNSLLQPQAGKLTPLGETYVNMPVHDSDLYYRIPGRLPAENYVALEKAEIYPTTDTDGFAQMVSSEAGAWLDYNIVGVKAGTYTVRLRVSGDAGRIALLEKEKLLGTVNSTAQAAWQTVETSISLPAGIQTIRVRCGAKNMIINWTEFTRK